MNRKFRKRHLHEDKSSSSESECLVSPEKKVNIFRTATPSKVTSEEATTSKDSSSSQSESLVSSIKTGNASIAAVPPNESATVKISRKASTSKDTSSSSESEYLVSRVKHSNVSIVEIPPEVSVTAITSKRDSAYNDTSSSSDCDNLVSSVIKANVSITEIPPEVSITAITPEKASTSKDSMVSPVKQANLSITALPPKVTVTPITGKASTSKEYLVSPGKHFNTSIEPISQTSGTVLTSQKASTSADMDSNLNQVIKTISDGTLATKTSKFTNDLKNEDKSTKIIHDSPKSTKKETESFLHNYASTTNVGSASKLQSHANELGTVNKIPKTTFENKSTQELEEEYTAKYASELSRELIFAIDVVYLIRFLHGLDPIALYYGTSGEAPKSPCDDVMDDALKVLWEGTKKKNGPIIENHIKNTGISYKRFQKMMIQLAEVTEEKRYNTARLLKYCVTVAHWAVCAELNGLREAVRFAPLVICRTFQKLKDAGKITSTFLEKMAEKAESINNKTDKQ